jgi:hypothetical protein
LIESTEESPRTDAADRESTNPSGAFEAPVPGDVATPDELPLLKPTGGSAEVDPASPPPWEFVHFAVRCPRCDEDVHGQSEPTCPTCHLTFSWQDLVPLEHLQCTHCRYHLFGLSGSRCPECGNPFRWEDVLYDYHRRQQPWFEYQWSHRPIRSLRRSFAAAHRPRRLWQRIELHDPPQVGALWFTVVVMLIVYYAGAPIFAWTCELLEWLMRQGGVSSWLGISYSWSESLDFRLGFLTAWTVPWLGGTLLGLLVLRQSMARCKVRSAHVLRIMVYTLLPFMVWPLAWQALAQVRGFVYRPTLLIVQYLYAATELLMVLAFPVALALIFRSLWCAYRDYLKMPHAFGVVLASQAIGIMCGVIGTSWYKLFG